MGSSYELQISSEARRKGLARILMRRLEQIGAERKMQKAMLTCLKGGSVSIRLSERS
jgi:ribosomal protein S18 acetylase RimI-like enzyme